jgi:sulfur relay (sulfurtransferase) DsrC/TusE family protein
MYITMQIDNLPTLKQITCTNDMAIYICVYRIYTRDFYLYYDFTRSYRPTICNLRIIFGTLKYSGYYIYHIF